jgi:hypothetical protein
MKFPKLWPADATSTFEKSVYAFVSIGALLIYIVGMQFSVWGFWGTKHNMLGANAQAAAPFWHIVGFIAFLFSLVWFYCTAEDTNFVTRSTVANVIILIASMALSVCFSCGFVFNG